MKDYYAILELPPTASQEEIREQYLLLVQAWHPDKFRSAAQKAKAEEKCKAINSAYDVLKDAEKRVRYDRELRGQPWQTSARERRRQAPQQQPREPAKRERSGAEREADVEAAEEWIRAYFEQARRRQSGTPLARVKQTRQVPIRALIVDDSAETRAHIGQLLSSEGDVRVVGEAADGRGAVAKFDTLIPDVAILCVNLPSLDGIAAAEAILRKHPLAKIVILSAQTSTNDIRRAAMAGARDYLLKAAPAEELRAAVRLAAGRAVPTSNKTAT